MTLRKKFILRISIILIVILVFTILVNAFTFRRYGIHNAEKTGKIVAQLVESGLTAHMLTGTMSMRHYFLDQIQAIQGIEKLWIIRGEPVIKQFGTGNSLEKPKDELDEKALTTGQVQKKLIEGLGYVKYRITIPYIASKKDQVNCLNCHQVSEGQVLGAISIVTDISDIRAFALNTTVMILIGSLVVFFLSGVYMYVFVGKYVNLFEKLKMAMSKAIKGDFSTRIKTDLNDEAGKTVREFNHFMEEIHQNFEEIKNVMNALADADLSKRINREMEGEFENLRLTINKSIDSLSITLDMTLDGFSRIIDQLNNVTDQISQISTELEIENKSIHQIKQSILDISQKIKSISENATILQKISKDVEKRIQNGEKNIKDMEIAIKKLNDAGEKISQAVDSIIDIANQTNLLALNAAIEAARAGEIGRGFAVVADEVRKLAETTSNFAKNIQQTVMEIFNNIKKVSEAMEVTQTGYTQMSKNYIDMSDLLNRITEDIKIQNESIQEMGENIQNVSRISENITEKNKKISEEINQLSEVAGEVKEEVNKFKIKGE